MPDVPEAGDLGLNAQPSGSAATTFREKTQLVADLRSTLTIWERDHGIEEAMFIATGGGERRRLVNNAIVDAVDAIGANRGVRDVLRHAIRTVEAS